MTIALITRRSQVQILPPPPTKPQVRGPFRKRRRASAGSRVPVVNGLSTDRYSDRSRDGRRRLLVRILAAPCSRSTSASMSRTAHEDRADRWICASEIGEAAWEDSRPAATTGDLTHRRVG